MRIACRTSVSKQPDYTPTFGILEKSAAESCEQTAIAEPAPAEHAGAWNFGPATGDTQPVSTVVDSVTDRLGFPGHWRIDDADHPHEAHYLKLDISKAVGELGYRPRLALDEALEWTAAWYRAFFDGEDMLAVTNNQIDRFRQHRTAKDTLQFGDGKAGTA